MSSSSHLAGSFLTLERRPRHGIARCLPTLILRFLGMSKIAPEYFLTPISGGVCVTLRDDYRTLGPIEVFTPFEELRSIRQKVSSSLYEGCISDSMFLQNRFNLDVLYKDFPEARNCISSDGRERRIVTSSFNKLACFSDERQSDEAIRILGLTQPGNKRALKWIHRKYVEDNGNLDKYKVVLPMANGSGALGEVLSAPLIGEPLIGYT